MVNQLLTQSFYRIPWSLLKVLFPQYPAKWLMFSVTVLQSFLCISLCKYCTKTRIKGHCAMVPLHEITVLTAPAVKTLVRSRFTVLFCSVWAKSNQLNTYLRNIFYFCIMSPVFHNERSESLLPQSAHSIYLPILLVIACGGKRGEGAGCGCLHPPTCLCQQSWWRWVEGCEAAGLWAVMVPWLRPTQVCVRSSIVPPV